MKNLIFVSILAAFSASEAALAIPPGFATLTSHTVTALKSKGLQCRSGQICAMICNKGGNIDYSLYEFAHYNPVDGFNTRIVQDDPTTSLDTQIQFAADRLGKVDQVLRTEYNKNVKTLGSSGGYILAQRRKALVMPSDKHCNSVKLAVYKHDFQKFFVDQNIYGQLSTTDRAGLVSRMSLIMIGITKSVGPQHLVNFERLNRRLFMTEGDGKVLAKSRNEPAPTEAHLQDEIRYRVGIIFPTPVTGVKQLADVRQTPNVFRNIPAQGQTPATAFTPINVAANNIPNNPPNPITPGSDVGTTVPAATDVQNGYAVPQLVGLPPEVASQNFAASNGIPVQPEIQAENPNTQTAAPLGTELDANITNTSVQGQPNQEPPALPR